ncbi:MAG: hypothetical protein K2H28_00135 [Ruminococcus sp.]|nr:hypothetical protein [Ruminococcus sp.]
MNNSAKTDSGQKYYLVDFSSVKENSFDGIEKLSANDNVIVFFVKGESDVDFSLLSKFNSCPANVTMKEVGTKELILPVISMYIGRISNKKSDIYLVCNDGKNYIKTAEIAIGNDIKISVQQNISGIEPPPVPIRKNSVSENVHGIRRVSEPVRNSGDGIRRTSDTQTTNVEIEKLRKAIRRISGFSSETEKTVNTSG